jgi:hypothetical protein
MLNVCPELRSLEEAASGRIWVYAEEPPREVVVGILGLRSESQSGFRSRSRISSLKM